MTRPLTDRNAEIVSLHDSGSTDAEIAAVYGIAPQRVGQIVRMILHQLTPLQTAVFHSEWAIRIHQSLHVQVQT